MATKQEKELIDMIYQRTVMKANEKIEKQLKEDQEEKGFENGSALYGALKNSLEKAIDGIGYIYEYDEKYGCEMPASHENGALKYDASALRLLKAIDDIDTYVL